MSACPSLEELEQFIAGVKNGELLTEHIEACASCRDRIEEIRSNNQLLVELSSLNPAPRYAAPQHRLQLERYDLIEPIGHGMQGVVYRAVQKATRRQVAIKFLLGGQFATVRRRARFDREVELAAGLRHPNIVTVFDSGTSDDGRSYYVMEFVDGAPLDAFSADTNPGDIPATLRLFHKICSAVDYAHRRGIIHRDLKPVNILVDATGEPRIVDFGLAKLAGREQMLEQPAMTQTGEFAGTFAYASPEQTRGDPDLIDTRTDVYALGVILYEMLTAKLPYATDGPLAELLRAIAEDAPRSMSSIRSDIDGELQTIVFKALAKEPDRRYPSAGLLARDIEHYLAGEPIDAKRDSAWYMLSKTVRRHRLPFALAAAAVVVLVVFSVAMSVAYRRASVAESNSAARSEDLARLLAISNVERGRAMGQAGNVALAEDLLWREYFAEQSQPRRDISLSPARWALWELYSKQPCLQTMAIPMPELAYASLSGDGQTAALVARGSHAIEIWNLPEARRLCVLNAPDTGFPCWLVFSCDGKRLVSGSLEGEVRLWNLSNARCLAVTREHRARINAIAISLDSSGLATADVSGEIRLWNTSADSLEQRRVLRGNTASVRCLAFTSNNKVLAAGSDDRSVRLWDATTGVCTATLKLTERFPVGILAFSPDGTRLVTVADDVSLWAMPSCQVRQSLPLPSGTVTSMRLNHDGSQVAVGSTDRTVQLWTLGPQNKLRVLAGHTGPVNGLWFSDDGRVLSSLSIEDRTVRAWDARGDPAWSTLATCADTVGSACYSADRSLLATASADRGVMIWDVATGALRRRVASELPVFSVSISRTRLLATGCGDGSAQLWDLDTGAPVGGLRGHEAVVNSVAFSPDGSLLATSSQDESLRLWNVRSAQCVQTLTDAHEALSRVSFSPDGKLVAAGGKNSYKLLKTGASANIVHVWDTTGALRWTLAGHRAPVRTVCFSADNLMLASGSDDQTIRLWELASGRCVVVLEGHRRGIFGLSFRGDGKLLVSGGAGGEIKLWDVQSHRCLATLLRDEATVFGVQLSPDGRQLTSWGADKMVTLWDLCRFDRCIDGNDRFQRQRLADAAQVR